MALSRNCGLPKCERVTLYRYPKNKTTCWNPITTLYLLTFIEVVPVVGLDQISPQLQIKYSWFHWVIKQIRHCQTIQFLTRLVSVWRLQIYAVGVRLWHMWNIRTMSPLEWMTGGFENLNEKTWIWKLPAERRICSSNSLKANDPNSLKSSCHPIRTSASWGIQRRVKILQIVRFVTEILIFPFLTPKGNHHLLFFWNSA